MQQYQKVLALMILVFIFAYSCSSSDSRQEKSDESLYELVKVDSLIIDEIEALHITDYNPRTKRFLAYGTNSRDCMEIDLAGNILNRVNLAGDGPRDYGFAMDGLSYFGEDIIVNGFGKYVIYDANWGFKSKLTSSNFSSPVSYLTSKITTMTHTGERKLIQVIDHNENGNLELKEGHFDTAKMIRLVSPLSENRKAALGYPSNSIYTANKTYYSQHQPILSVNEADNKLYLALPLEPKLFVYNLDDSLSLDKTIDLDFVDFSGGQGIPYEDQFKNPLSGFGKANELNYVYMMTNSSILDISSNGKMTMVEYKTGIKNKDLTSYQEALSVARLTSKTITSFIIEDKVVHSTEQSFPYATRMDEMRLITPYLNEEVELDYNKFYIYELQEIN